MSKNDLCLIRHTLLATAFIGLFMMMSMGGYFWPDTTIFRLVIELIVGGWSISAVAIVAIIFNFITIIFSFFVGIFVIIYCFKGFKAKQLRLIDYFLPTLYGLLLISLILWSVHLGQINYIPPEQVMPQTAVLPSFAFYLLCVILLFGITFYIIKTIRYFKNKSANQQKDELILPTNFNAKLIGLLTIIFAVVLVFALSTTFIKISFGGLPTFLREPWYESFWYHYVGRMQGGSTCLGYLVIVLGFLAFFLAIATLALGILQFVRGVEIKWFKWVFYTLAGLSILLGIFNIVYVSTFGTNIGPNWARPVYADIGAGAVLVFLPGLLFFMPLINKLNKSIDLPPEK